MSGAPAARSAVTAVERAETERGRPSAPPSSSAVSPVLLLAAAGAFAFPAAVATAHHSIAAVYDSGRQLTVEGRVTEFQFVNPHPILVIDVSSNGAFQSWRLELDNRSELAAIGIAARTFAPGDLVVATGSAGRNEAQRIYALKVERPADGLVYEQIGYSPRINRR